MKPCLVLLLALLALAGESGLTTLTLSHCVLAFKGLLVTLQWLHAALRIHDDHTLTDSQTSSLALKVHLVCYFFETTVAGCFCIMIGGRGT